MSLLILKFYHYLSGARSDSGLTVRRIGRDGTEAENGRLFLIYFKK